MPAAGACMNTGVSVATFFSGSATAKADVHLFVTLWTVMAAGEGGAFVREPMTIRCDFHDRTQGCPRTSDMCCVPAHCAPHSSLHCASWQRRGRDAL
jgi:hypothetical protein